METRQLFFNAHIRSHIDYASTVWDGSSDANLKRLNSLHRRAAKLILPDPSLTTDQKLAALKILPLKDHLTYNKGMVMFKALNDKLPPYITTLFTAQSSTYSRSRKSLIVPRPRIDLYKTSLTFSGSSLWNALPRNVTTSATFSSFKASLIKYLFLPKAPP